MVVFWWTRWRDVGCSSLHERHISSDLSYRIYTAALLFWRVIYFLLIIKYIVVYYNNTIYTFSEGNKHNNDDILIVPPDYIYAYHAFVYYYYFFCHPTMCSMMIFNMDHTHNFPERRKPRKQNKSVAVHTYQAYNTAVQRCVG